MWVIYQMIFLFYTRNVSWILNLYHFTIDKRKPIVTHLDPKPIQPAYLVVWEDRRMFELYEIIRILCSRYEKYLGQYLNC